MKKLVAAAALSVALMTPAHAENTRAIPKEDWVVNLADCDASLLFKNEKQGGDVGIYINARGPGLTIVFGSHTFSSLVHNQRYWMRIGFGNTSVSWYEGQFQAIVEPGKPPMLMMKVADSDKDKMFYNLKKTTWRLNRLSDEPYVNEMSFRFEPSPVVKKLTTCG